MSEVTPTRVEGAPQPGTITSRVHPGDPLKVLTVVGFESLEDATTYLAHGFFEDAHQLRFKTRLGRDDGVSFGKATFVGVYAPDEAGKMLLRGLFRVHADLALTLGSCGWQLTVSVELPPAAPAAPLER